MESIPADLQLDCKSSWRYIKNQWEIQFSVLGNEEKET